MCGEDGGRGGDEQHATHRVAGSPCSASGFVIDVTKLAEEPLRSGRNRRIGEGALKKRRPQKALHLRTGSQSVHDEARAILYVPCA